MIQQVRNDKIKYRPFIAQIRWISATIVVVGHAIALINSRSHGSHVLNYISDMRAGAVTIFFLISGYLVGGSVIHNFICFDFPRYAIARFSRIYIVLLPALLLTVSIDFVVAILSPDNIAYANVWQGGALGSTPIFDRYSINNLISTVLCIEPIFEKPLGSAGSLWSLGYEWIFYFIFPFIYGAGFHFREKFGALIVVIVSCICMLMVSRISAAYWAVWLLGAYASEVECAGWLSGRPWKPWLKGGAALTLIGYVATSGGLNPQIGLPLAGISGMVFLACGISWEKYLILRADETLASFSYSLYVTHLQLMTGLTALLFHLNILPEDGFVDKEAVLFWCLVYIFTSFLVAYIFGRLFEGRTKNLALVLTAVLSHFFPKCFAKDMRD